MGGTPYNENAVTEASEEPTSRTKDGRHPRGRQRARSVRSPGFTRPSPSMNTRPVTDSRGIMTRYRRHAILVAATIAALGPSGTGCSSNGSSGGTGAGGASSGGAIGSGGSTGSGGATGSGGGVGGRGTGGSGTGGAASGGSLGSGGLAASGGAAGGSAGVAGGAGRGSGGVAGGAGRGSG